MVEMPTYPWSWSTLNSPENDDIHVAREAWVYHKFAPPPSATTHHTGITNANSPELRMNTFVTVISFIVALVSLLTSTTKHDGLKAIMNTMSIVPVLLLWYYVDWYFLSASMHGEDRRLFKIGSLFLIVCLYSVMIADVIANETLGNEWKIAVSISMVICILIFMYMYKYTGPERLLRILRSDPGKFKTDYPTGFQPSTTRHTGGKNLEGSFDAAVTSPPQTPSQNTPSSSFAESPSFPSSASA